MMRRMSGLKRMKQLPALLRDALKKKIFLPSYAMALLIDSAFSGRLGLSFGGVPASVENLRFKRQSSTSLFDGGFGLGDISSAMQDAPAIAADGLLLRPAAAQVMPSPVDVLNWAKSGSITITDSGQRYSGLIGAAIGSAGATSNRAYKNFAWTSGESLFVMVLYSIGTAGKVGITLRDDIAATSTIVDGAPGALALNGTAAAGAVSQISDVAVSGSVRMATMFFTPNSNAPAGHIGVGPRSATNGQTVICFGANVWRSNKRQEFEKTLMTRAAESMSPQLPTGNYDFLLLTIGGGYEWRTNVAWVKDYPCTATLPMTATEPAAIYSLLPITTGKDRVAAIFAWPSGLSNAEKLNYQTILAR